MSVTKVNAEDWSIAINTGTVASPTWTAVAGIEDFDVASNTTRADTTDIDSGGAEENRVIRRGKTLSLNGHWLEDPADGSRDAGQDALETAAEAVGDSAEVGIQMESPGGTTYTFQATAEIGESGDKNDVTKFSITLVRTGGTTVA